MSKKAAEHHKQASEHLTHAARHHGEAAKHHEAGSHEKAAHHAHVARGHVIHSRDTLKRREGPSRRARQKIIPRRQSVACSYSVDAMARARCLAANFAKLPDLLAR
jgi:hypothetical protein